MTARRASPFRQAMATAGGEIVNRGAQLASLSLTGWVLGVEGLAKVGEAWALCNIALALAQYGPDLAGMREMGLSSGAAFDVRRLAAEISLLKLLLFLVVAPLLVVGRLLLGPADASAWGQLALQALAMGVVAQGHVWAFRGLERPFEQTVIRVTLAAVSLGLTALLLAVQPHPWMLPLAEAGGGVLGVGLGWWFLGGWSGGVGLRRVLALAGPSIQLSLGSLCSNLAWQAPVLACARWGGVEELGRLSGALRLVLGGSGFLQVCLQSLYPALARLYVRDAVSAGRAVRSLMLQGGLAMTAGIGLLWLAADWLVPLLLGREMQGGVWEFRLLCPLLVPVMLAAPPGYALMAMGRNRSLLLLQAGFALVSLLACQTLFAIYPGRWAATVLHPLLWGLVLASLWQARREGLLRAEMFPVMLDPRQLLTLLGRGRA